MPTVSLLARSTLLLMLIGPAHAEPLIAYTEDFPPFNYQDEAGKPAGFAVELLADVMKAASVDYRIEFVPWARALQSAKTQPNTLVFTTARTPDRERVFDWIGPFSARRTVLMGLHSGTHVANLDAARSLRVGVINGDAGMEFIWTPPVCKDDLVCWDR
jgi:polar amino acid transport system substrate-binding protein